MGALGRLSYANVVATLALFLALGGGAYALSGKNTVRSDDIVNGQVKSDDIGGSQVKNGNLAGSAVTGGKVAADTITAGDVGSGAIGSGELLDGAVGAADLGAGAVGSAAVADNSLGTADVNESDLFNDNSLTGADINEASLAGVEKGAGRTLVTGDSVAQLATDVIPVADGTVTFTCAANPSMNYDNHSGADALVFSADRALVFEDDGVAGNGALGISVNTVADGATDGHNLTGPGALGWGEIMILTNQHVAWVRGVARSLVGGCDYVLWITEDPR
jgi:hypothetical protein